MAVVSGCMRLQIGCSLVAVVWICKQTYGGRMAVVSGCSRAPSSYICNRHPPGCR